MAGIAFRNALKVLKCQEDALEAAQDTMVAYQLAPRLVEKPDVWVARVAHNRAVNLLRKRVRGAHAVARVARQPGLAVDREHEAALDRMIMDSHFEELSEREGEVARRRFIEDMSRAQIAADLGISLNTVKSLLRRAVKKIRESLGDCRGMEER
ncbi:MAG: sigma-70 family RNA polymerase sigma factor [Actinomycetota bacterium]|nr:sigma-70 family RNA polymerase sigma factor [Actinomycetota bacterium]